MTSSAPPLSAPPLRDAAAARVPWIPAPRTPEETGIRRILLEDLTLTAIARERETTTAALSDILALQPKLIEELVQRLRKALLIEVTGMIGTIYKVTLTGPGRRTG